MGDTGAAIGARPAVGGSSPASCGARSSRTRSPALARRCCWFAKARSAAGPKPSRVQQRVGVTGAVGCDRSWWPRSAPVSSSSCASCSTSATCVCWATARMADPDRDRTLPGIRHLVLLHAQIPGHEPPRFAPPAPSRPATASRRALASSPMKSENPSAAGLTPVRLGAVVRARATAWRRSLWNR